MSKLEVEKEPIFPKKIAVIMIYNKETGTTLPIGEPQTDIELLKWKFENGLMGSPPHNCIYSLKIYNLDN